LSKHLKVELTRALPIPKMTRGNQRDKAREANQKKLASQVRPSLLRFFFPAELRSTRILVPLTVGHRRREAT
jgi:4F5 protein related disordered region